MQLFSPKTNEKSPAFIDAVYPDSVRPRADRNLQKRRQHALRLLPLVQQQHPRFGRPAQGRHAVPAGGRKKRHPHAGRRPLVQGRPLLLQQRTGLPQGVDSPRAGLRARQRPADLLFFHLVAADSLLHEARAIHAGAIRTGALHGAGRAGPAVSRRAPPTTTARRSASSKRTTSANSRCLFSIPSWPPSSSTPDGTKKPPKSSKKARRGSPCPNTSGR